MTGKEESTQPPNISIIIPVFNCAKYLGIAISSVLSQSSVNYEVIVVDDGSTDASLTIAQGFVPNITVVSQRNQGACVARNVGIRAAQGCFIKFLDSDDYLLPGALAAQYEHAITLGAKEFSYGRVMRHIESEGRLIPHSLRDGLADNQDTLDNLLLDPPVISAILYPAEMLKELCGFDECLLKRQDYDLFARALLKGFHPVACSAPICAYRSHDCASRVSRRSSRESFANQAAMFERQAELLKDINSGTETDVLRRGLAATIWVTARNCVRAGYSGEALRMFRLSDKIDCGGNRKGRKPYRMLVGLLGPIVTEELLDRVKRFFRCRPH